jgi:hypothetical protein
MCNSDKRAMIEWCLPDSPAQRYLEAKGYREVEWKRFHPGEGEGWVKMVAAELSEGVP